MYYVSSSRERTAGYFLMILESIIERIYFYLADPMCTSSENILFLNNFSLILKDRLQRLSVTGSTPMLD